MWKITREFLRQGVAERWRRQYCSGQGLWSPVSGPHSSEDIHKQLLALGTDPTEEQIAGILRAWYSWVRIHCGVCGEDVPEAIVITAAGSTLSICGACLSKAQGLIECDHDTAIHLPNQGMPYA